jgi:hypothetical protein
MWSWLKYMYLAIRLGTLWENLKAVRASDPAVTSESYQPASAAILDDPGVQRWLSRLSPEEQARFTEGLTVFLWGLDALTE